MVDGATQQTTVLMDVASQHINSFVCVRLLHAATICMMDAATLHMTDAAIWPTTNAGSVCV